MSGVGERHSRPHVGRSDPRQLTGKPRFLGCAQAMQHSVGTEVLLAQQPRPLTASDRTRDSGVTMPAAGATMPDCTARSKYG